MRGAPQNRLAELILRIRSRISAFVLGRPERGDRLNAKDFAMLSDHGRWCDEYQVEELRPDSLKQHPEQTVGQGEAKAARALPPQDDNPMSQATSSSSGDARALTRNESRKNESRETRADRIVIMDPDGVVVARRNPQSFSRFTVVSRDSKDASIPRAVHVVGTISTQSNSRWATPRVRRI